MRCAGTSEVRTIRSTGDDAASTGPLTDACIRRLSGDCGCQATLVFVNATFVAACLSKIFIRDRCDMLCTFVRRWMDIRCKSIGRVSYDAMMSATSVYWHKSRQCITLLLDACGLMLFQRKGSENGTVAKLQSVKMSSGELRRLHLQRFGALSSSQTIPIFECGKGV